jgi:hypothetical protein
MPRAAPCSSRRWRPNGLEQFAVPRYLAHPELRRRPRCSRVARARLGSAPHRARAGRAPGRRCVAILRWRRKQSIAKPDRWPRLARPGDRCSRRAVRPRFTIPVTAGRLRWKPQHLTTRACPRRRRRRRTARGATGEAGALPGNLPAAVVTLRLRLGRCRSSVIDATSRRRCLHCMASRWRREHPVRRRCGRGRLHDDRGLHARVMDGDR